jgi:hypothetical protein
VDPNDESLIPVVFQDVNLHELHQDFLTEIFPERFPLLAVEAYEQLVARRATRSYFAGVLYRFREGGRRVTGSAS